MYLQKLTETLCFFTLIVSLCSVSWCCLHSRVLFVSVHVCIHILDCIFYGVLDFENILF